MARGALHIVLEHLRRTFWRQHVPALTDGELLDRFVRTREESNFTLLVERHAPMVFTVARRVLRDAHDAEDVFQATFFVLARKASSISRRAALAGWLYQVAYRLALKAKADKARRQARERRMVTMRGFAPDIDMGREELQALLDEELSRLPEKYRTPLVLHYLEGQTKDETARQLGWKPGTVSGRLARGRDLLRKRLVRRGFILSTGGISTLLVDAAGTAAVGPGLVTCTANAALVFAYGTEAGTVSTSATILAKGMVHNMLLTKIKTIAVIGLMVSVVGAGVGAVTYRHLAGRAFDDGPVPTRSRTSETRDTKVVGTEPSVLPKGQAGAQQEAKDARLALSASGKVVDEKGTPIQGATVFLREVALVRDQAVVQQPGYTDVLARTTSDAAGRFVFKEVAVAPMGLSPSNVYRHPWNIVVTAAGHGIAWHVFKTDTENNLTIVMGPGEHIRGQLLDSKGKAAAGVQVRLNMIEDHLDPDPRKRVVSRNELQLLFSQLPLAVVTDADGRFLFPGLPKNLHIGLVTTGTRFARKFLSCATVDKVEIERLNAPPSVPKGNKLLANGFTAALEPSGSVRGLITYRDTHKPTAGARVSIGVFATSTDSDGRYAFDGFGFGKHYVHVRAPESADYLTAGAEVIIAADKLMPEQNFALEPGSVITGELRDKETAQAIPFPHVSVNYQTEGGTPRYFSTSTKADGSFRIVVAPGKGKLSTPDSVPGFVPQRFEYRTDRPSLPITIKPGETLTGRNLLFLRGGVVHGRLVDADGKPVAGAVFQGATEQPNSAADGTFTLRGLSREQKSYFLVLHAGRALGVKLTIEPAKSFDLMDVRLKPTQAIKARVLDENKQPVANAEVSLRANIKVSETGNSFSYEAIPVHGPISTDAAGIYKVPNLVVDGSYTLLAALPGFASAQAHFRVEVGKNVDVPDLILLANRLVLGGVVVDPGGAPLEDVQVVIMPRNQALADNHDSMKTNQNGRFYFHGLPRGEYRLLADLWKKTGSLDKDGRPESKREAGTELRVQSGQENIRIVLHVPQDPKRAANLIGGPAPEFPVAKWLNATDGKRDAFKIADHAGRAVLLAFLDEAKPSQGMLKKLNDMRDKYAAKGLMILRVYEAPVSEVDLAKDSPTLAALVQPGPVAGRTSEAARKYGVTATPSLYLIDRQGILRQADVEVDMLDRRIEELLK